MIEKIEFRLETENIALGVHTAMYSYCRNTHRTIIHTECADSAVRLVFPNTLAFIHDDDN